MALEQTTGERERLSLGTFAVQMNGRHAGQKTFGAHVVYVHSESVFRNMTKGEKKREKKNPRLSTSASGQVTKEEQRIRVSATPVRCSRLDVGSSDRLISMTSHRRQ